MTWIVAFIAAAVTFGGFDALWLRWAGPNFYHPRIGEILARSFRFVPALIFYAAYVFAIVWFAVRPGLSDGLSAAALNGALLGSICYATYDLTNHAPLKRWSTVVTITDICWGAAATTVAASVATIVAEKLV